MVTRFGRCESVHELTDSEVVALILRFGRADIYTAKDGMVIDFLNDYDNGIKDICLIMT